MRHRFLASIGVLAVVIAVMSLATIPVAGQTPSPAKAKTAAAAKTWTPPRTADGQPDLQGVWDFRTITPMERPSELAGKQFLTDEEAAELEKTGTTLGNGEITLATFATVNFAKLDVDRNRQTTVLGLVNGTPDSLDVELAYNDFWWDRGTKVVGTKRTSLVVDPQDGKIPALTPEAQKRAAVRAEAGQRAAIGPEDRGVSERCIMGFNSGPPIVPAGYNQNVQLFQNPGYVVILNEMVHNARIVPLDGRPHGNIRQWVGDSSGHWEGNTLVVDTINFYDQTAFQNSGPNLHLTERFTRVDADTLLYEFTANDPTTWTRPWTAQIPMRKTEAPLYEYACHEGNYGMFGLLSAARFVEKAAEEAAKKESR